MPRPYHTAAAAGPKVALSSQDSPLSGNYSKIDALIASCPKQV